MRINATTNQVMLAFETLPFEDRRKLLAVGAKLIQGTRFTGAIDLMHEAVVRTLNGGRAWPVDVPFAAFLMNAMKSIAHGDRICFAATLEDSDAEFHSGVDGALRDSLASGYAPSAEQEAIANQERWEAASRASKFQKALSDDAVAAAVLRGWLAGSTAVQVMGQLALTPKQYDAARKRLWRKAASWAASQVY